MKKIGIDRRVIVSINQRVAKLLIEERRHAGLSIETVAASLQLPQTFLELWEKGIRSPPANIAFLIINSYGAAALRRFSELDSILQQEKYVREKIAQAKIGKPTALKTSRASSQKASAA
jgi:transcriptional regulator with XRE-family HTH domain